MGLTATALLLVATLAGAGARSASPPHAKAHDGGVPHARPHRAAQDSLPLARIQAALARPDVLCGLFAQEKDLVGLRRPVASAGRFCLVAGRGALWHTTAPFTSVLRLTPDAITESDGDRVTTRVTAQQEPTIRLVNEVLFAVLAGDLAQLARRFTIAATIDGTVWRARLVPRDAGFRSVIGELVISGDAYVRRLELTEASGDRTRIGFRDIATGRAALQPADARALGLVGPGTP